MTPAFILATAHQLADARMFRCSLCNQTATRAEHFWLRGPAAEFIGVPRGMKRMVIGGFCERCLELDRREFEQAMKHSLMQSAEPGAEPLFLEFDFPENGQGRLRVLPADPPS